MNSVGKHHPSVNGANHDSGQNGHEGQVSQIIAQIAQSGNSHKDLAGILLTYPEASEAAFHWSKVSGFFDCFKDNPSEGAIIEACVMLSDGVHPYTRRDIEQRLTHEARLDPKKARAVADMTEIDGCLNIGINKDNALDVAHGLIGLILEKPKNSKHFNFRPLADVLKWPDPEFLIFRLLVMGGTSLLTARHKSFKSFFALDMALCITRGRLWHGYEVQRGPVVYIAAEGATGLKQRAAAWLDHHRENIPENFFILDVPFRIHEPRHRKAFIEELGEIKPALIILDTLARCAVGLDENNAGDMGTFADAIGELARETGSHVMIVHHNNKGGEYRGSSALPAAVDTHLTMERQGETVRLKTEKQKDFEELPDLLFEQIVVPIPNTRGEKHSLVFRRLNTRAGGLGALTDIEQKTFDALRETYGDEIVTSAKWKRATFEEKGLAESTFGKARRGLMDKKAVVIIAGKEGGRGKDTAQYQVASEWLQNSPGGLIIESDEERSTLYGYSTDTIEDSSNPDALRSTPPLGVDSVEDRVCSVSGSEKEEI
jgi:hypothetical protein